MKSPSSLDCRFTAPAFAWWLLVGCLPLAVWLGIQLGAAPQIAPIKDGGLSKKTQTTPLTQAANSVLSTDTSVHSFSVSPEASDSTANLPTVEPGASSIVSSSVTTSSRPSLPAQTYVRPFTAGPLQSLAPARLPLVFREFDPVVLGLSEQDVAAIETLQAQFQADVGPQNARDPAYRRRWQNAQWEADQKLRSMLGWTVFNRYQLEAAQAR